MTEQIGVRGPAAEGAKKKRTSRPHADCCDDRLGRLARHPVTMPCHAVVAIAIEVAADAGEVDAVQRRQVTAHLFQKRRRQRDTRDGMPTPHEPGFTNHAVVHGHGAMLPRQTCG